jgi:hypothetical protein
VRSETLHAHQWDASVGERLEHAVEMCLIDDLNHQDAVRTLRFDDGTLERARRARAETALNDDAVGNGRRSVSL